jgi:hypothetical protein
VTAARRKSPNAASNHATGRDRLEIGDLDDVGQRRRPTSIAWLGRILAYYSAVICASRITFAQNGISDLMTSENACGEFPI